MDGNNTKIGVELKNETGCDETPTLTGAQAKLVFSISIFFLFIGSRKIFDHQTKYLYEYFLMKIFNENWRFNLLKFESLRLV